MLCLSRLKTCVVFNNSKHMCCTAGDNVAQGDAGGEQRLRTAGDKDAHCATGDVKPNKKSVSKENVARIMGHQYMEWRDPRKRKWRQKS